MTERRKTRFRHRLFDGWKEYDWDMDGYGMGWSGTGQGGGVGVGRTGGRYYWGNNDSKPPTRNFYLDPED